MVQHILGFFGGVLWVQGHEHRANLGNREGREEELGAIRQDKGDAVALAHAQLKKTVGDAIDFARDLAVTPVPSLKNQRQFIGMALGSRTEQLG